MKTSIDEVDFSILIGLGEYPPLNIRQLGERVSRSHVTVFGRLKWLEENGYVTRSGRTRILTEKGMRKIGRG